MEPSSEGAAILEKARELFDVAGANRLDETKNLLLGGLESRPDRDLDTFGHVDGKFHMYGYETYVRPRLEALLAFIRELGYRAEPFGRIGYPLEGQINLKSEAVKMGLGKRGKSTVILHPEYGPRLRFSAVMTNAPLPVADDTFRAETENPVCAGCRICLDHCPARVLEPYRMPDIQNCLSYLNPVDEQGNSILCDLCLKLCPAGKPVPTR